MQINRTFVIGLICFCLGTMVSAQSKREIPPNIPTLGGHRFMDNAIVSSAFSNTSFRLTLGYGESKRLPLNQVQIGDTVLSATRGSLAYVMLNLNYEQRIKEWLSFYLTLGGSARVGLDTRGLLTQGLNTYYGYEIGWKVKIWDNEKNRLAGKIGIYNYEGNFINVFQYISDIINRVPDPQLSRDIPALQTVFGFMYARSFGSLVGLQLEASGGIGDTFIRQSSSTDFSYQLGGVVDINLYPKTNVPLGFSAAMGVSSMPDLALRDSGGVPVFNFKLAFTGTPDFMLSVNFTRFKLPVLLNAERDFGSVLTEVSSISMIYYFN